MLDYIFSIFDFVVGLITYNDFNVQCALFGIDDAIIAPPLIAAGANILGGILGSKSQSSANKANLKIARETNALNYKMFQEQQKYNFDMWNMNNSYNSPKAQVSRAIEAGLNPYFNSGNLVSASNSSAPTSPSLPSLSTPHVQAYDPSPAFSNIGNIFSNLMMQQAQINNLNQLTKSNKDVTYAQIQEYLARAEDLKHSAQFRATTNQLLKDTYDYQKQSKMYDSFILREQWLQNMAQTKVANIQAEMAKMHLDTYPQELQLGITQQIANIMLTKAQSYKSYKEAALAAAQTIESSVRAEGYRISNRQAEQLIPYVVDEAKYNSYIARHRSSNYNVYGTGDAPKKTNKKTSFSFSIPGILHYGSDDSSDDYNINDLPSW